MQNALYSYVSLHQVYILTYPSLYYSISVPLDKANMYVKCWNLFHVERFVGAGGGLVYPPPDCLEKQAAQSQRAPQSRRRAQPRLPFSPRAPQSRGKGTVHGPETASAQEPRNPGAKGQCTAQRPLQPKSPAIQEQRDSARPRGPHSPRAPQSRSN